MFLNCFNEIKIIKTLKIRSFFRTINNYYKT